jgi:hypothetical protein
VAILGGGYATLAACVVAFRTEQWLWLSIPLSILVFGVSWFLVARWIEARARSSIAGTVYGLTTRRALIVQTYPSLQVQTLPIETITDVTLIDERRDFADLCLHTASGPAALVFRGLAEASDARAQLMRVIRDPQATGQEIAASEAYALAMRQLMIRPNG